ncbi:MAG: MATE family efflux transporter [Deltaproteobacteria bacterium]|nr:MATE family efflux transporter [Deltaproteobacteria bacterium]
MDAPPLSTTASVYVDDPGKAGFIEPVLLKRIVLLGFPVIIGMLTQTLINQVDGMFIGRLPETEAVPGHAAMGPALILLWAFGGFLSAISVGTQALTARRYGEGDAAGAGKVMVNSAVLALVTSTIATIVAIATVPILFPLMHDDPNVQRIGISFCQIRFLGILPMVVTASLKSFYDGIGRTHVHMTVAITMNFVNLLLCWLLVFGKAGAPALGVNGAAWAAVVSGAVGASMMILYSVRTDDRQRFRAFQLKNLDGAVARSIATLSVFSGFATVVVMTGFALFLKIPAYLDAQQGAGGANTAAAWDVITIMMVVFMTCIAFGTSTATLVSQSLGAKKPDLASRYGWQSVYFIVAIMAFLGLCVFAFPEELIRLFLPKEEGKTEHLKDAVVALAVPSLRFSGFIAPIAAAALVLTQALYGAGESRFVAVAEFTLHFFCLVPLSFIFSVTLGLGLIGCWYATALYGLLLLGATAHRFWSGSWKRTIL